MTLVVGVYAPTVIALSADSRTTGIRNQSVRDPRDTNKQITVQTNIVISDAADKVFRLFQNFGVATWGDAMINGLPIAHFVEDFEAQSVASANVPSKTQGLADALLAHFRGFSPVPQIGVVVAGYDGTVPWVVSMNIGAGTSTRVNVQADGSIQYGVVRGGDTDVADRLLSNPVSKPPFQVMNTQDAVDFSRHLIRSTIDQLRFEPRFSTVGGAIDTLLVRGTGAEFAQKKKVVCS